MLFQQRVEQPNAVKQSKNAYFDAGFLVPTSQLQNRANYRIFRKISNWFEFDLILARISKIVVNVEKHIVMFILTISKDLICVQVSCRWMIKKKQKKISFFPFLNKISSMFQLEDTPNRLKG